MKKIIPLFIALALFPALAFAQQPSNGGGAAPTRTVTTGATPTRIPISIPNPVGNGTTGVNSLTQLFFAILNFVLSFSYAVIAFFLILSGFKFVTAQGSEDGLKEAKATFKYTIIGAIIVIGAQVIVEVVKNIFTQISA